MKRLINRKELYFMTIEIKAYVNVCLCGTEDSTIIYFTLPRYVCPNCNKDIKF